MESTFCLADSPKPRPCSPLQEIKLGSARPGPAAEACEASGITLSTRKRAALSPLLKHSSHDLCCSTLQRGRERDDAASVYSHPASLRFGKTVAEKQLQSFGGSRVNSHHTEEEEEGRKRGGSEQSGGRSLSGRVYTHTDVCCCFNVQNIELLPLLQAKKFMSLSLSLVCAHRGRALPGFCGFYSEMKAKPFQETN